MSPGRKRLADALGLALIVAVLLDLLHPSLLLLPTITAGGDTPCHYPTAVWVKDHLLPQLRLHGWYPGSYLGQPLLLYYFPLPFVLMAALAPLTGMPVAFKLGTVLGVFLLPLFAYVSLRRMRLPFPAPLLGGVRGARLPLRRGEPDLGRHHRLDADGGVLLHVRDRPGDALPGRARSCARGRTRAVAAGRCCWR